MALASEVKQEVIGKHKRHKSDSGSPEVQIALLSQRLRLLLGGLLLDVSAHVLQAVQANSDSEAAIPCILRALRGLRRLPALPARSAFGADRVGPLSPHWQSLCNQAEHIAHYGIQRESLSTGPVGR